MLLRTGGKQVIKWAAEGAGNGVHQSITVRDNHRMNHLVFCNVRHTSVAGDMLVSCKCTAQAVNQGGTADSIFVYSSLTEVNSVRDFFIEKKAGVTDVYPFLWQITRFVS